MKANLKPMAFTGFCLMISAAIFALAETIYFGSNWMPESKAEFICDYISAYMAGAGGGLFAYSIVIKTIEDINLIVNYAGQRKILIVEYATSAIEVMNLL